MPPRTRRPWSIELPSHDALEGLSQAERLELINRWDAHLEQRPAVIIMTCVVVSLSIVAASVFREPFAGWLQSLGMGRIVSHVIAAVSISLPTAIVGFTIGYWLLWGLHRQAYRQALRDVGRDVCVSCGYWLRGLNEEVKQCPECGAEREAMAMTDQRGAS